MSNIVAPTASASALHPGRRVVNSLTLVMTTLIAFIIVSMFALFFPVKVSPHWLGRFVDVGVPLLLAGYFAYVTVREDLRELDEAHALTSLWRAHFNRAVLIYPPTLAFLARNSDTPIGTPVRRRPWIDPEQLWVQFDARWILRRSKIGGGRDFGARLHVGATRS